MVDESELVRVVRDALGERAGAIVLYGSRARGDAFDHSDTDIAVFLAGSTQPSRADYRSLDRSELPPEQVSIVLLRGEGIAPSGFVLELARAYRVLWQATPGWIENRLAAVQDDAKGAERRLTPSGDPYWVGV
jgi:predicted nucleotidyltransferase